MGSILRRDNGDKISIKYNAKETLQEAIPQLARLILLLMDYIRTG